MSRTTTGTTEKAARTAGSVTSPRIDPRIRERRIAVLRLQGRRRLRRLVAVAVVVVVAGGVVGFLRSPLAKVRNVEVIGAHHTARSAVLRATDLGGHPLMVNVDSGALERRVRSLPWVAWVTVSRHWPSSVEVRIGERRALAQTRLRDGSWAVLDPTGRVLGRGLRQQAGLVAVDGVGMVGRAGSWIARSAGDVLAVAASLPAVLVRQVSVVVKTGDQVELALRGGATALLGPPTDLSAKYEALLTVLDEVSPKGVRVIDVRVPSAPALTRG